jgi:hypothetical protein
MRVQERAIVVGRPEYTMMSSKVSNYCHIVVWLQGKGVFTSMDSVGSQLLTALVASPHFRTRDLILALSWS